MNRFDRGVRDLGGVLATWIVLLAIENFAVGVGYRAELVGTWEMGAARLYLSPIALAAAVPFALLLVIAGHLAGAGRRASKLLVAFGGAAAGGALAYGVSFGRHFAAWNVRVSFIGLVAIVAGFFAWLVARLAKKAKPTTLGVLGALLAVGAWLADAFVLRRLYPAFHLALLALTLAAWALTWLFVRRTRAAKLVSSLGLLVAAMSSAWTPHAAKKIATQDNVRRVLAEHAPLLGRAVLVGARIAPPPPIDDDADSDAAKATLTSLRATTAESALDWRGRDVVLVTIDATRADHVSSYGYRRNTTPNIDALAARGARFTHAYCPTPHTSYSVASMMTGKYQRPLLAMGATDPTGGETWADILRRYGFRTAAFYPPAVFFIDAHRFTGLRDRSLGFEYKKEEFATPELRRAQIAAYLAKAPKDKPLFLWLHLFEPHEPYEMHPDHPFSGDPRVDAYDSEIATADALAGDVVRMVEARRPGAVVMVSADHGEELGDHGGRYHGTTVYEEQVRVPLVVVGPGVSPRVIETPVQTIDLLPTMLSAIDVPVPARIRGRDLRPLLAPPRRPADPEGAPTPVDEGLAFAETDDWTMLARGTDRLVCARKIGACTLYDVATDPGEHKAVVDRPQRSAELKKLTGAIARENGRIEANGLPDALRRGLQGDRDAAEDVAPLLDDARVDIRREAARCGFRLRAPEMAMQLRRALARDEDAAVRQWSAVALVRIRSAAVPPPPEDGVALKTTEELVSGTTAASDARLRTAAALALAEQGDRRGEGELLKYWEQASGPQGDESEARELLAAFAKLRSRSAVPVIARTLGDVRLRPFIVDTLAEIGDPRAKEPLLAAFAGERYVHVRQREAEALLRLGAHEEMRASLTRFAGVPEPMFGAVAIARQAGLLRGANGALSWPLPAPGAWTGALDVPKRGAHRLFVLTGDAGAASAAGDASGATPPTGTIGGTPIASIDRKHEGGVWAFELPDLASPALTVDIAVSKGILALWLVPRAAEIPPPPPVAWDAGTVDEPDL